MIQYLNVFFYDIYPYICATVFFLGSWLRYDYGQYTWRASSSQMLDKRGMVIWSNLFHIGILGIFFGHLFGMLTPHWMYAWFLPIAVKQQMAMILVCATLLSSSLNAIGLIASYGNSSEETLCNTSASLLRIPSAVSLLPLATGLYPATLLPLDANACSNARETTVFPTEVSVPVIKKRFSITNSTVMLRKYKPGK